MRSLVMESLDRLVASAERRRDTALTTIEMHKQELAAKLRQASDTFIASNANNTLATVRTGG
jgi:hypothetical protein